MNARSKAGLALGLACLLGVARPASAAPVRKHLAVATFSDMNIAAFRAWVDSAQAAGFTTIRVVARWTGTESAAGVFDFRYLDQAMDYVVATKGMTAIPTLWMVRGPDAIVPDSVLQRTESGTHSSEATFSFSADAQASRAARFLGEVVRRYGAKYRDGILAFLPVFSYYAETEYPAGGYDYSDLTKSAFREHLRRRFASGSALQAAWGGTFSDIAAVVPSESWAGEPRAEWYRFRSAALEDLVGRMADTLHAADPGSRMAIQYGSVWDVPRTRGSLLFPRLARRADLFIVDDAPSYPHAFSMDYLRGSLGSIPYGNELDGPKTGDSATYWTQARQSVEHGASMVLVANWNADSLGKHKELFRKIRRELIDPDIVEAPLVDSLVVSAKTVLGSGTAAVRARHATLSESGRKRVDVRLVDDLSDTAATVGVVARPRGVPEPGFGIDRDHRVVRARTGGPWLVECADLSGTLRARIRLDDGQESILPSGGRILLVRASNGRSTVSLVSMFPRP